jgi:hypothetical protein
LLGRRGVISDLLSVYAGNGLIIAGFACETVALISLFDRRREWTALQSALAAAGFVLFASSAHVVSKRIAVSSVVTIAQYLPALFVMLRAPLTTPLRKGTVALYGAFMIVVGVRAWFGFVSPATLLSPGATQSASFLSLIFLMFVGTTAFVLLLKEQDDRQMAESEREQRILRGLLPICAHCKKIRDDKGYWYQLERYITAHSDAVFSHGICPECLPALYPDLAQTGLAALAAPPGARPAHPS